jgi:ATPase family AAA domain-containing protein 3A/B
MKDVNQELIERIAEETEGFSGREIMKMVVAWHDAAFTTPDAVLTPEVMEKVLSKFKQQHKLKKNWSKEEARLYEKMIDTTSKAS